MCGDLCPGDHHCNDRVFDDLLATEADVQTLIRAERMVRTRATEVDFSAYCLDETVG